MVKCCLFDTENGVAGELEDSGGKKTCGFFRDGDFGVAAIYPKDESLFLRE